MIEKDGRKTTLVALENYRDAKTIEQAVERFLGIKDYRLIEETGPTAHAYYSSGKHSD